MMEQSLKFLYSRIKKPEYTKEQAESKVCQEIFIMKLGASEILSKRIAFKGGIILDSLARGERGYTKDIDFDLIKYPLSNEGLSSFVDDLNKVDAYRNVIIKIESQEELRHKNYKGKRLMLSFSDSINKFSLMVDVGIYLPIIKKNLFHDYEVAFGGSTKILVNPIERMLAEKLSTFAIYGTDNTRSKDLFDAFYIISNFKFDCGIVKKILNIILVKKSHYFKTLDIAINQVKETLNDKAFVNELNKSTRNWTKSSIREVIKCILCFLESM